MGKRLHMDVGFYVQLFSWMSLSYLSVVLRGLATSFLMARKLPPEVFGQFRYLIAWFGLAGIFSLSGMQSGMIRGLSKGHFSVVKKGIRKMLLFIPLGSVFLAVGGVERWYHGERGVALGFFVAALAFPLQALSGLYGPILTGFGQIKYLVKVNTFSNILYALGFAAVLFVSTRFTVLVAAYLLLDILLKGAITIREFRRIPISNVDAEAEEDLALGAHLSAIGVFQVVASQFDQIIIQRFGGYTRLAEYNIALLLPDQVKDFVNSVSGVMLGRLSKYAATEKTLSASRRHFWTAFSLAVCIFLGYGAMAPFVMPWLFPKYAAQVLPSIVYASSLIFVIPTIMGTNFLQAHGQTRLLWRLYAVNVVAQFFANIGLVPLFGSWGGIVARILTRIITAPVSYPSLYKKQESLK